MSRPHVIQVNFTMGMNRKHDLMRSIYIYIYIYSVSDTFITCSFERHAMLYDDDKRPSLRNIYIYIHGRRTALCVTLHRFAVLIAWLQNMTCMILKRDI